MIIEQLTHIEGCECKYTEDGEQVDILCLSDDERESVKRGLFDIEAGRVSRMPTRKKT